MTSIGPGTPIRRRTTSEASPMDINPEQAMNPAFYIETLLCEASDCNAAALAEKLVDILKALNQIDNPTALSKRLPPLLKLILEAPTSQKPDLFAQFIEQCKHVPDSGLQVKMLCQFALTAGSTIHQGLAPSFLELAQKAASAIEMKERGSFGLLIQTAWAHLHFEQYTRPLPEIDPNFNFQHYLSSLIVEQLNAPFKESQLPRNPKDLRKLI